jgi:hypothetical protein
MRPDIHLEEEIRRPRRPGPCLRGSFEVVDRRLLVPFVEVPLQRETLHEAIGRGLLREKLSGDVRRRGAIFRAR